MGEHPPDSEHDASSDDDGGPTPDDPSPFEPHTLDMLQESESDEADEGG